MLGFNPYLAPGENQVVSVFISDALFMYSQSHAFDGLRWNFEATAVWESFLVIVRFDKQVAKFISGGRPWVKTCAHWTRHEPTVESHGEHHCRCHLHCYCLAMIAIANSSVTIIVIIIAIVIYTVIIMPSPLPSSLRPSLTSPLPSSLSSSLSSPHISSVFLYVHHHKIHDVLISLSWPQKSLYD